MADRLGRFSEPALQVLISLLDGPKHGHAISADIEAMVGKRPGPGTLYGAIGRLEQLGLVRALTPDGRRRPYSITTDGRSYVRRRLDELTALTRHGEARLVAERAVGKLTDRHTSRGVRMAHSPQ